jgi:hypothetical protein
MPLRGAGWLARQVSLDRRASSPLATQGESTLRFCVNEVGTHRPGTAPPFLPRVSDTDRQSASITHATAQQMMVRGLIERDRAATRFALTDQGRAVLAALARGEG